MLHWFAYIFCTQFNWVSEASPTLGCSIEISSDIYVCVGLYVHRTWPNAQSQFWAVKTDL